MCDSDNTLILHCSVLDIALNHCKVMCYVWRARNRYDMGALHSVRWFPTMIYAIALLSVEYRTSRSCTMRWYAMGARG